MRFGTIAWHRHRALAAGAFDGTHARHILAVKDDPSNILANAHDESGEQLVHAANDCVIVNWARTIRFDRSLKEAERRQLHDRMREGARISFGESVSTIARTYGLIEGSVAVEPAEIVAPLGTARVYDEAIIVLAIEPTPPDALPAIATTLSGAGGPSGVLECVAIGNAAIVEFRPDQISPALVLQLADVELRRFHGYRRVRSLAPLPADMIAAIAAAGMQAPEIAPDRILETLLEESRVE